MQKRLASSVFASAFIMLGGCSTSAVPVNQATLVPPSRLFSLDIPNPTATITVVRDSGMMGGGCLIHFYLNSNRAAIIDTAEKLTVDVAAGEMQLGAKLSGNGLCGSGDVRYTETTIATGQHKLYRVYSDTNGNVQVIPAGIISQYP